MTLADVFNAYAKHLRDNHSDFEKIVKKRNELNILCSDALETSGELLPKNTYAIKGSFQFIGKETPFEGYFVLENDKFIGNLKEPYGYKNIDAVITGVANKEITEFYFVKTYGGLALAVPIYYHAIREKDDSSDSAKLNFDAEWSNNCQEEKMVSPQPECGRLRIYNAESANKAKITLIKKN